jgi:type III secretion protein R
MGAIESIPLFIAIVVSVGLLPFFVVATTSFVKISIVLLIVRNALGIQQMPANILLYVISIVLTLAIMGPILSEIITIVTDSGLRFDSYENIRSIYEQISGPIKEFLMRYSKEEDRIFFIDSIAQVWRDSNVPQPSQTDMSILIPSFLVSELRKAFENRLSVILTFFGR